MKNDYTHITAVLDRSGSMATCAEDTKGGFDQFIKDQKEAPGKATFTLVQFDTEYEVVHDAIDIKTVPPLTLVPRGNTALLDALGKAIAVTGEKLEAIKEDDRPATVIFVVLTDGQENSSKEFTKEKIRKKVELQSKTYNWQFVFIGANMDAIAEAASLGVNAAASLTYNARQPKAAYAAVSDQVRSVRAMASTGKRSSLSFSDEDRRRNRPS